MPALCYLSWYSLNFWLGRKVISTQKDTFLLSRELFQLISLGRTPLMESYQWLTVNWGLLPCSTGLLSTNASFYWLTPSTTTPSLAVVVIIFCHSTFSSSVSVVFVCAYAVSQTFFFKPPGDLHFLPVCLTSPRRVPPPASVEQIFGGSCSSPRHQSPNSNSTSAVSYSRTWKAGWEDGPESYRVLTSVAL